MDLSNLSIADAWFDKFKQAISEFSSNLANIEARSASSLKIISLYSSWRQDCFDQFESPETAYQVLISMTWAHFFALDDNHYFNHDLPLEVVVAAMQSKGLAFWFNVLDNIDKEVAVVFSNWILRNQILNKEVVCETQH